ncbi:unnamed protein product [Prunus brigantina]
MPDLNWPRCLLPLSLWPSMVMTGGVPNDLGVLPFWTCAVHTCNPIWASVTVTVLVRALMAFSLCA